MVPMCDWCRRHYCFTSSCYLAIKFLIPISNISAVEIIEQWWSEIAIIFNADNLEILKKYSSFFLHITKHKSN